LDPGTSQHLDSFHLLFRSSSSCSSSSSSSSYSSSLDPRSSSLSFSRSYLYSSSILLPSTPSPCDEHSEHIGTYVTPFPRVSHSLFHLATSSHDTFIYLSIFMHRGPRYRERLRGKCLAQGHVDLGGDCTADPLIERQTCYPLTQLWRHWYSRLFIKHPEFYVCYLFYSILKFD